MDLSPNASAGRNVSRQGGQNVSTTAITPVVDRDMAPTQGVLVPLKVTATLRKLDKPEAEPVVITDICEAKLRVTANRLLRAGAPGPADAVLRDENGDIRLDQHGRALLLGDPEPPTGQQKLPPWHGNGENKLRGPGKSLPSELEGVKEAREQALTKLSEMGLIPPLGDDFEPLWQELPSDPFRRRRLAAQLDNYDRVDRTIRADRIAGAMNTTCQSGLLVQLVDHRLGQVPRNRVFRLSTELDYDNPEPAGSTGSRFLARLGISSRATQQTSGRAKGVPISAGAGVKDGPDAGQRGWTAKLGLKLSRSAIGRSFNWSLGTRVNRVTLNESTGETDHVRPDMRITFTEVTAEDGDSEPLADVWGSVLLPYDSTLARAEPLVFEANPMPPHPEAVRRSIPEAVDAGNPADRLFTAVDAIRGDTTGFVQLHAALSSESLVSNTEWLNGRYELPLVITPPPGTPAQALADGTLLPQEYKVVIRSEAVSHTFAAMNDQNTANINFTMSDVGHSSGTSASGGVSGEVGAGMADADKSALSGKLGVGRVGGKSQSTGTGQTSGEERLRVNDGVHYELIEKRRMVADVLQGDQIVQNVPLQDALVQKTLPEFEALELYGAGKFDLPLPIAADVAERYLTRKLELSPRTAAAFVRRYKLQKAGVDTGLPAEHTDERLNQRVLEKTGVQESTAATAQEKLEENLVRIQQTAETRRVVGLPESYDTTLGSSQLYMVKQEGTEFDVDLIPQLHQQLEQVAPGLLADEPLLRSMLDTNLAADSYQGHLVDMLGPRGFSAPIEIPVEGQAQPDILVVKVKARFVGDVTVDGTAGLSKAAAIGLVQKYKYRGRDRSTSHSTTYSGGVEGKHEDTEGAAMSGGAGTDRTRQVSAGSSEQTTTIDRTGDFDLTPVYRTIVFTTEVERIHNAGAAAMGSARWRLNRTVPAAQTTAAQPEEMRAELTAFVPRGVVEDPPETGTQQAATEFQADHRHVDLPAGAAVESMLPYRKGETVQDELYNRITAHLGRRDVLGPAGLALHEAAVGSQLKPSAMEAGFQELTSPGGLKLEPMSAAGNGRTTVAVQINARAVGWKLVSKPVPGQSGSVWREQHQAKSSTTGNHLGPVTATGGAGRGIISVSGAVGEQVKEQSSDSHGTRLETSAFRNGDLVTVRVPVVYDVTVDQLTDKGRGTPRTKNTTHLRDTARGEYYVRMLYHEYLEGLRQMEAGGDISLDGALLQAIPEELGEPDLWATEYGVNAAGQREHQPYRPMLNALDQARIDRAPVVVSIRDDAGKEHLYQALPDGRMAGVNDGGFGSAFATLNRDLVQMAERRVDLRELFNTMEPGANFSTEVADALVQSGVPDSMLKGLTYSTATREQAPASGQGAKPTVGGTAAGRTVTSTTSGPSLTGP
ncbi:MULTISPECIES: hypothetical protein [unclassified Kribbella]|uniref:hypothetical protein n=1 Tax=unclassified Kribbella TaxID=2644121 RepID=UPI003016780D